MSYCQIFLFFLLTTLLPLHKWGIVWCAFIFFVNTISIVQQVIFSLCDLLICIVFCKTSQKVPETESVNPREVGNKEY